MSMISFSNNCDKKLNHFEKRFGEINELFSKKFKLNKKFNVAVSLVNKDEIHRINFHYRKVDRPTDVLSFSYYDEFKNGKKISLESDLNIIGEIYICSDVAIENIKDESTLFEEEMDDLFIHGMLHILGYDHIQKEEEIEMKNEHARIKDDLNLDIIKKISLEAKNASKLSISPYSKFKVGAALYLKNKKIIKGANIENSAYPVTICAERCAIFSCISQGEDIKTAEYLAIWTDTDTYASPCGSCRQVMKELLNPKCRIILLNKKMEYHIVSLDELLPFAFTDKDLFGKK